MKRTKNNSYFLAFFNSAIFLPFLFFFFISFFNNCAFWYKNFTDYNWRFFLALFGGINSDLFIFSIIILFLSFICNKFPRLKILSLFVLHSILFIPVIDYLYYRATLERFNWIVLQFINFYSTKGYIGNFGGSLPLLFLLLVVLVVSVYFCSKREKFIESYFFKPFISICIFTFFAVFFTHKIVFPVETNFFGHFKVVEGKNTILKNLSRGSLFGFFTNHKLYQKTNEFILYSEKEKSFLEKYGFLPNKSNISKMINNHNVTINMNSEFDKVIVIVLESFAYEYIHAINSDIPAEASPFFDYLIKNYPHLNNFYTSDCPTLQGINAILSSKIPFDELSHVKQKYNLGSILEEKNNNSIYFVNGQSNSYGNEYSVLKNIFGFKKVIGYEELTRKYPEPKGYVWGFDDIFVYIEANQIIKDIKNTNYFMFIKLLNGHQPIFHNLLCNTSVPSSVACHSNDIVKGIFNADQLLKQFILHCEEDKLLDDKTLVIITADHYPPLGYGHTDLIKSNDNSQLGKLPLIFYTKNREAFKNLKQDALCCQLDIAPTLCYLLGIEIPKEHMGQNLLSPDFKPRSIGILSNESVFFESEDLSFSESLTNPATSTVAIKKWINNLTAR